MSFSDLKTGVNLGGWISQYSEYSKKHFANFITEKDLEKIASWGLDHVRLPVDAPVLMEEQTGSEELNFKEEGFSYIDRCIEWCKKLQLNLVLDLHRAPGYSFSTPEENSLFSDQNMGDKFVSLWEYITERYHSEGDFLIFELLNEVVEEKEAWNNLACRTIDALRQIDEKRKIIFGGMNYNAVSSLKHIRLMKEDPHVIYTFHFYQPFLFTHQKASWNDLTSKMKFKVRYPGPMNELENFVVENPETEELFGDHVGRVLDKSLLKDLLKPAKQFQKETDCELYCGEYGVIDQAPQESRVNWYRDFTEIMEELAIPRTAWSYKEMNFGLVDENSQVVDPEIIKIISS
ncbi:MAG: glycoside hydrolase family 5 protein, partial [Halanaerobiaceae bacterium]